MKKINAEMIHKIHANGGRYDTRTYRYIVADTATTRTYKRLPIDKLGTTAALTEWEELEAPEC